MPAPNNSELPPWVLADRRTAARRVQGLRTDRSLNQYELAEAAGLSRDTVQRVENGRVEIKLSALSRIAHALNVPITDLLA